MSKICEAMQELMRVPIEQRDALRLRIRQHAWQNADPFIFWEQELSRDEYLVSGHSPICDEVLNVRFLPSLYLDRRTPAEVRPVQAAYYGRVR